MGGVFLMLISWCEFWAEQWSTHRTPVAQCPMLWQVFSVISAAITFILFIRLWPVSQMSCSSFQVFQPTPSLSSTHHVEAASRAESALAQGRKKVQRKRGKKAALKKTELAKLCFKVGWHIRDTSSYSSAFLRDIDCSIQKKHSL